MTDHIALTGGEWRPDGGIMRWFPALTSVPEPPPFDPDEIACYSCGATLTQGCRTKSGLATKGHAGRLPRRCPCGADLLPQRSLCPDCARANELASKRAASRRWYQEKRSA